MSRGLFIEVGRCHGSYVEVGRCPGVSYKGQ